MRLMRGQIIAGLSAELARELAKVCHAAWTSTERAAYICRLDDDEATAALTALRADGYLDCRSRSHSDERFVEWITTVLGAALAMASFAKPITRRKTDELLAAVLARVTEYNADDRKPYLITELKVFGSHLDLEADRLGDLDLDVMFAPRIPDSDEPEAKLDYLDYAERPGRRFATFVDRLFWPRQELLQILRARSSYINVHVVDVDSREVSFAVVYPSHA